MGRPTNRLYARREESLRQLQETMFLPARRAGESHGAYVRRCEALHEQRVAAGALLPQQRTA